jgi:hypothetical protein
MSGVGLRYASFRGGMTIPVLPDANDFANDSMGIPALWCLPLASRIPAGAIRHLQGCDDILSLQ